MASPYHMNRLLQGDVGSGKTVVAGLAMYAALSAGEASCLDGSDGDFGRAAQGKLAKSFFQICQLPF